MSWEDQYRDHTIWDAISETKARLSEAISARESEASDRVFQLQALLSQIGASRDYPSPVVTVEHLASVETRIREIHALLPDALDRAFTRNGNQSSPFVMLAQLVRPWPAPDGVRLSGLGKRAEAVDEAFTSLDERLSKSLHENSQALASATEDFEKALVAFKSEMSEGKDAMMTAVDEKVSDLHAEFDRIKQKAHDAEATTEQQKARLDDALTSHQEKFSELQEKRTSQWNDLLRSNQAQMDEHLSIMDRHGEQSRNVLAAVGVNATAADYEAYAQAQGKVADRWRVGAVAAFSVAAAFFLFAAGASFFGFGIGLSWWEIVFQKIGAPGGAAAVGYFLQREASQHRKQEREAKQVQLTLTALEPFIANLPETQQREIRMDTARELFTSQRGSKSPVNYSTNSAERQEENN